MRIFVRGVSRPCSRAHQDDHAEVGVVPAVHQQRGERRVGLALGRGQAGDQRVEHRLDALAGLGRDLQRARGVDADDLLDLPPDPLGLGRGEVHLVEHRHDLVVVVHRLVGVGQRLRLDPLGRVDDQQRALAGGERAAHLVGEVHVAGGVHQVDHVLRAVRRAVGEAHGLRLDGDAALALELHGVEHLAGHLALLQAAAALDQAVGERRLAVIDVGDDRDVADVCEIGHGRDPTPPSAGARISRAARRRSSSPRWRRPSPPPRRFPGRSACGPRPRGGR